MSISYMISTCNYNQLANPPPPLPTSQPPCPNLCPNKIVYSYVRGEEFPNATLARKCGKVISFLS